MLTTIRVAGFMCVVLFCMWGGLPLGCSKPEPTACKKRSDCPEKESCIKRICIRPCKFDSECSDGKTCVDNLCGGVPKGSDAGDPDKEKQECTPGTTEDCYSGAKDTEGTGPCKGGTRECQSDGTWGDCEGEILPKKEECDNGVDENCDGTPDEGCEKQICKLNATKPCYFGPPKTKGVGPCKPGKQTCRKGTDALEWSQCEGDTLPVAERCSDQVDNDCDGDVNEGCACKTGQSKGCKATNGCAGLQVCKTKTGGTEWGECVASKPSKEKCDGYDNDCDGKTDNVKGTSDAMTQACLKVCKKGTETCEGGKWVKCDAEEVVNSEEECVKNNKGCCNGKDDDCDGKIDNIRDKDTPLIRGCKHPTAKGVCADGASELCKKGKWDVCTPSPPVSENCNGVDDDCDGKTDNPADKICGEGQECRPNKQGTPTCLKKK